MTKSMKKTLSYLGIIMSCLVISSIVTSISLVAGIKQGWAVIFGALITYAIFMLITSSNAVVEIERQEKSNNQIL